MASAPIPVAEQLFGTDGIRKVVGSDLNPLFLVRVISAYSRWVGGSGPVMIAHDFRTTSDGIARICAGTLQMNGVDVYELGVMPTPCLQFNVRALGGRAGLMVTASHNPTEFNGIKFAGPDGLEIPPEAEAAIEQDFGAQESSLVTWKHAGKILPQAGAVDRYLASILRQVDGDRIRDAAPRVVLDCGNGTSSVVAPRLLRELGVGLKTLNANPDGAFSGRPSDPIEENLSDLIYLVKETRAQLGVAFDGDSDRVTFVDDRGRYVPGYAMLALLASESLRETPGGVIATSITSSSAIEEVTKAAGGQLVVSRSGSLPVAIALRDSGGVFGGEENGHYYWPKHQNAPDGPMSMAKVVDIVVRSGVPLSELVDRMPRYSVLHRNVPLPPRSRKSVMERVRTVLSEEADRVVAIDGVKAFYGSRWLLVRPSGTEPICRLWAQANDRADAEQLIKRGQALLTELMAASQS